MSRTTKQEPVADYPLYKFLWHRINDGIVSDHDHSEWIVGEWRDVGSPRSIATCSHGFHASRRISDARGFVHGNILAKVSASGVSDIATDKEAWQKMRIDGYIDFSSDPEIAKKIGEAFLEYALTQAYLYKDVYCLWPNFQAQMFTMNYREGDAKDIFNEVFAGIDQSWIDAYYQLALATYHDAYQDSSVVREAENLMEQMPILHVEGSISKTKQRRYEMSRVTRLLDEYAVASTLRSFDYAKDIVPEEMRGDIEAARSQVALSLTLTRGTKAQLELLVFTLDKQIEADQRTLDEYKKEYEQEKHNLLAPFWKTSTSTARAEVDA